MGSTLWEYRRHMQFHSLIHTLAGLNEIQHLLVQFQCLLCLIWFGRISQHLNISGKFTKPQHYHSLPSAQPVSYTYRSPHYCHRREISKVVMCPIPAWFPSSATSTLRAASERHSVLDFLGGHRWFETAVHPNSIKQPHRCSMVTSERPFKPSIVVHRPFPRSRHYFSAQL